MIRQTCLIGVERGRFPVNQIVEFGRSLLSYGVVMLVAVALMGIAIAIGITLAKKNNAKKALQEEESSDE